MSTELSVQLPPPLLLSQLASGTTMSSRLSSAELSLLRIDFDQVEFCTDATGAKQQLGSGSFGAVSAAWLSCVCGL